MKPKYFIPFDYKNGTGGPYTFMGNFVHHCEKYNYKIAKTPRLSSGIFFPVLFNLNLLKFYKDLNAPIIQRLDGVYYSKKFHNKEMKLNETIQEIYSNFATHVVFQSEYSKAQCNNYLGEVPKSKYSIIYNGANLDDFYPDKKREFNKNLINFITTGSFRKPIMLTPIINALEKLMPNYSFKLTIVGKVSETLMNLISNKSYINFVGEVPNSNVSKFLRNSDIFLHSQLNDNCPNAVIEAISCGIPVVGFNSGSMKELCEFNKGLLVETPHKLIHEPSDFDTDKYSDKIESAVQNFNKYKNVSIQNWDKFSFDNCFSKYMEVFEKEMRNFNPNFPNRLFGYSKYMLSKIFNKGAGVE